MWWICKKGHEWQASPLDRKHSGCPYCSERKVVPGENDFATFYPDLAKEWDYEKNNGLLPTEIHPMSNIKVMWKCKYGHSFGCRVCSRVREGIGCGYCSGRYAIKGENDLETLYPEVAKEWNYSKNENMLPSDFLPRSGKIVWWKCEKGHEFRSKICIRTRGTQCRICWEEKSKNS